MKFCTKCGKTKQESEFNKNKSKKDGLQGKCRDCHIKYSQEYYEKNTEKHKKLVRIRDKKYTIEIKNFINNFKIKGCCFCCENEFCCLDFHHLRDKKFNIADAVGRKWKLNTILEEIKKCIIICSNCHRKLHKGILKLEDIKMVD